MTDDGSDDGAGDGPIRVGEGDSGRQLRHELRTPINQIIGYSELLAEEARDSGAGDLIPDLEKITLAARKLTTLVDEVLEHGVVRATLHRRRSGAWSDASRSATQTVEEAPSDEDAGSVPAMPSGARPEVLVVDDSPDNRDMLARRLVRAGYVVRTASDGEQALASLADDVPDLMLLDIMMPGIDGFEVLKRVRDDLDAAELPVIMATARSESDDVVRALKSGANDYVTKPLDFPLVLARVEAQLELKRIRDESSRLMAMLAERNRLLRRIFGRYSADEVVDRLLDSPESLALGGVRRRVTVLFSDIRGFSDLSARLEPELVIEIINGYLEVMTQVILRHHGTIDELIGDGILVLFGAPHQRSDDALRAVACAVDMQLAIPEVNARNRARGLPEIEVGIALNTGDLVLGNIGSEKRTKYGVVGAAINQAARIESLTVGGQVLAAESTLVDAGADVARGDSMILSAKGLLGPLVVHDVRGVCGTYDLHLPEVEDELLDLDEPVPVRCAPLLEGKLTSAVSLDGSLTRLSRLRAELSTASDDLRVRQDVNLRIRDERGTLLDGAMYAKVTRRVSAGRYEIHFTSVPPALRAVLSERLD